MGNMENFKISYDCAEVIEDLKQDIAEFGENAHAWAVWVQKPYKIPFSDKTAEADILVNYLLDTDKTNPPTEEECEGGIAVSSTLRAILKILEKQNSIL